MDPKGETKEPEGCTHGEVEPQADINLLYKNKNCVTNVNKVVCNNRANNMNNNCNSNYIDVHGNNNTNKCDCTNCVKGMYNNCIEIFLKTHGNTDRENIVCSDFNANNYIFKLDNNVKNTVGNICNKYEPRLSFTNDNPFSIKIKKMANMVKKCKHVYKTPLSIKKKSTNIIPHRGMKGLNDTNIVNKSQFYFITPKKSDVHAGANPLVDPKGEINYPEGSMNGGTTAGTWEIPVKNGICGVLKPLVDPKGEINYSKGSMDGGNTLEMQDITKKAICGVTNPLVDPKGEIYYPEGSMDGGGGTGDTLYTY